MPTLDLQLIIEDLIVLLQLIDVPLVTLEQLVELGLPSFL
jgi:hypothetical protein